MCSVSLNKSQPMIQQSLNLWSCLILFFHLKRIRRQNSTTEKMQQIYVLKVKS